MIVFYCSKCKKILTWESARAYCDTCGFNLILQSEIWRDLGVEEEVDKDFYDNIYKTEKGLDWFQGLNRGKLKAILEKISISYVRERFFKKWLKGNNNLILDLACGAGREYFSNYGDVVGVDLSMEALQIAKKRYKSVLQSGVNNLPFSDNSFDYIISSDFFGHVRNEDKDRIISEIYRVLKPGGVTLHLIETDSKNIWFRIAHRSPDLFQKYFIEKIGGHIGLEMPNECVERFKHNNFNIVKATKIWGLIWPIRYYCDMFDNEYLEKSWLIKVFVFASRLICKVKIVEVLINILFTPINWLVESVTPINHGQGLFVVAKK